VREFPLVEPTRIKMLRGPAVDELRGTCRTSRFRATKAGILPPPIKTTGATTWPEHEIEACLRAEMAGATIEELQDLVRRIVEARAAYAPADAA